MRLNCAKHELIGHLETGVLITDKNHYLVSRKGDIYFLVDVYSLEMYPTSCFKTIHELIEVIEYWEEKITDFIPNDNLVISREDII